MNLPKMNGNAKSDHFSEKENSKIIAHIQASLEEG